MSHEEETHNFTGDPVNDYCDNCLCSIYCIDDDCDCDCHDEPDFGDDDED